MSKSSTYENGVEITETIATNTVTVNFSRKMGRENYGNEEAGIFLQVVVDHDESLESIEQKIKGTFAFAKTLVYDELGVDSTTDEGGIVRDAVAASTKAAPKSSGAKAKPSGGAKDYDAMWTHLVQNRGDWFDNRDNKKNPKGPDFKAKRNTQFADEGLWLNDKTPEWVKLALNEAEAA